MPKTALIILVLFLSALGVTESPPDAPTHIYPPSGTVNGLSGTVNPTLDATEVTPEVLGSIYTEFETALFEHLDSFAYAQGSMFFDALRALLQDPVLLYARNERSVVPYLNTPSTLFAPTNESLTSYLDEAGYESMADFHFHSPIAYRDFILAHVVASPYRYDWLAVPLEDQHPRYFPLRSSNNVVLNVDTNDKDVFINGIRIINSFTVLYKPDYAGNSYVHIMRDVLSYQ